LVELPTSVHCINATLPADSHARHIRASATLSNTGPATVFLDFGAEATKVVGNDPLRQ
jgi:hypothetical protein